MELIARGETPRLLCFVKFEPRLSAGIHCTRRDAASTLFCKVRASSLCWNSLHAARRRVYFLDHLESWYGNVTACPDFADW